MYSKINANILMSRVDSSKIVIVMVIPTVTTMSRIVITFFLSTCVFARDVYLSLS